MLQDPQSLPLLSKVFGLNKDLAQGLGIVWGVSITTLLLMFAGGLGQILKHKKNQNPYLAAGAKSTTIHALLGLCVSLLIALLLIFFDRVF